MCQSVVNIQSPTAELRRGKKERRKKKKQHENIMVCPMQLHRATIITRAQQLLGSATVPEQSGPKSGGCCAPFCGRREAGSRSNTMPHGPRATSVPSGIFIHPTVWPQYTNVTDRQAEQTGKRSHSIGRTVTCTDRPKSLVSIRVLARSMDKSNGDGVETENSFTLGVIGVAVSGPEEATSDVAKLLPVDRQPLPV